MMSLKFFCEKTRVDVLVTVCCRIACYPRSNMCTNRSQAIHKLRFVGRRTRVHFGGLRHRLLRLHVDCVLRERCARHCDHAAHVLARRSLRCGQRGGRRRSAAVAHHVHLLRIAAEKRYVLVHPSEGGRHVEQSRVAGELGRAVAQNAQRPKPILDRHENDAFRCDRVSLPSNESRCNSASRSQFQIHTKKRST